MRNLMLLFVLVLFMGLISCDGSLVEVPDKYADDQVELRAGDVWTSLAPLPAPVEGASIASIGNKIYTAFGYDAGNSRKMRIYDIDKDTWSMGAMAPPGYESAEGVGLAHDGKFYSVGGRSIAGDGQELLMYDPVLDSWTVLPSMTYGRQGLAAVVVGDYIYAIGGRTDGGPFATSAPMAWVEKYDIFNGTWTTVASLPVGRSDLAAAAVGGKIYIFGGYDGTNVLNSVMMYNPETDTWTGGFAPVPTLRGALYGVGTKGNKVYVIGGWDNQDPFSAVIGATVEAYKVSQDTWETGLTPMITPRAETGCISHGGRIYVIGGGQPGFGNPIAACEVYKP
jgi:N-acetylneuraminic acid mutarotase